MLRMCVHCVKGTVPFNFLTNSTCKEYLFQECQHFSNSSIFGTHLNVPAFLLAEPADMMSFMASWSIIKMVLERVSISKCVAYTMAEPCCVVAGSGWQTYWKLKKLCSGEELNSDKDMLWVI